MQTLNAWRKFNADKSFQDESVVVKFRDCLSAFASVIARLMSHES